MVTSECDSKDILSYARSLNTHKKNKNVLKTIAAMKVIRDICDRAIKRLSVDGKRAENYFNDIF